jgi:hypothetical protein
MKDKLLKILGSITVLVLPFLLQIAWEQHKDNRSLALIQVSTTPLQPEAGIKIPDLSIYIGENKIKSPYISTIILTNDGNQPVTAKDIDGPIEISIKSNSFVEQFHIDSITPSDLKPTIHLFNNKITVQPLLLNEGDDITLSIITSGDRPEFVAAARITGISKIRLENAPKRNSKSITINTVLLLAACITTLLALAMELSPAMLKSSFPWPLLLTFLASIQMQSAISNLAELTGMENLTRNTLILLAIAVVIIVAFAGIRRAKTTP